MITIPTAFFGLKLLDNLRGQGYRYAWEKDPNDSLPQGDFNTKPLPKPVANDSKYEPRYRPQMQTDPRNGGHYYDAGKGRHYIDREVTKGGIVVNSRKIGPPKLPKGRIVKPEPSDMDIQIAEDARINKQRQDQVAADNLRYEKIRQEKLDRTKKQIIPYTPLRPGKQNPVMPYSRPSIAYSRYYPRASYPYRRHAKTFPKKKKKNLWKKKTYGRYASR